MHQKYDAINANTAGNVVANCYSSSAVTDTFSFRNDNDQSLVGNLLEQDIPQFDASSRFALPTNQFEVIESSFDVNGSSAICFIWSVEIKTLFLFLFVVVAYFLFLKRHVIVYYFLFVFVFLILFSLQKINWFVRKFISM